MPSPTRSDPPGVDLSEPEFSGGRTWEPSRLPPPRLLALGTFVALVLAFCAWLVGQQLVSSPASRHAPKGSVATASNLAPFRDPAGAFTGGYPPSWQRLPSTDPQIVLLATGPDGASFLVRKTQIGAQVSAANLGTARRLTDRVVRSGNNVTFLRQPQEVTLGGLPGYLYLYTFDDPATGERGAHAHYFLFQGTTMITLVFQALPANRILPLAPLFDRIAASVRALPG